MQFLSDNTAPAHPAILAALESANRQATHSYGDDAWTARLDEAFSQYFATPVRVFAVATGTAANALSLACLTAPWGGVLCSDEAHILQDEAGACELQSGGARLSALPTEHGRIDAQAFAQRLETLSDSVHSVQTSALSLTQSTECGTVYDLAQLRLLSTLAHDHGLRVHLDGARFANALAHLGCTPADMTWRAGIDVLSFGATKNGALAAEAVVFFDAALAHEFERRRKRAAHLYSKHRYLSAQLLCCLEGDWFMDNARRANALAQNIGAAAGSRLRYPVQANAAFVRLAPEQQAALRAQGFEFYPWGPPSAQTIRLVVSWHQPQAEVEQLCEALRACT